MKIKEAKEYYKLIKDIYFPTFDELVGFAEKKGFDPMNNNSFTEALLLNKYMFDKTNNHLMMVIGSDNDDISFIEDLKIPFVNCLKRISKNKGIAKIICLNPIMPLVMQSEEIIPFIESGMLNILMVKLKDRRQIKHFTICDDILREEEIHGVVNDGSSVDKIKAKIHFNNNLKKIDASIARFNYYWRCAC